MKKIIKKARAAKIVKKLLPGAPFLAKNRFLVDFGVPAGSQNRPKMATKKKSKKKAKGPHSPANEDHRRGTRKIHPFVKTSD